MQIIHIDGGCSRVPCRPDFNKGNVEFELQLYSTTVITVLGTHEIRPEVEEESEIPDVDLADIIHHENETISKIGIIYF